MMSSQLLASVAALSEDERVELLGYIESTLDGGAVPSAEQQVMIQRRVAEMKANPELGLSKDEAIAAARALLA